MTDRTIILQIVQHLKPGGLENLALDLVGFAPEPFELHILSLEGNASSAIAAWPKLQQYRKRLHFLDKKPGLRLEVVNEIIQLARQLGATALHSHHLGPLVYTALAARKATLPLVHSEHNSWHLTQWRQRLKERLMVALGRPALVADANHVARDLRRILPWTRPRVIMNGIDSQRFTPAPQHQARQHLGLPANRRIIGCAARLETGKNHRLLVDVLQHLPHDVDLAFAGHGSERCNLQAQVIRLGLQDRVHFLGTRDDMPVFYQALDLFCLPSLNEGLPLCLLEAQACNIPVVCSDVGGCKEAICPDCGIVVPPGDKPALTKALSAMLNHQQPAPTPRPFVTQNGDIRRMAAQYARLYPQGA